MSTQSVFHSLDPIIWSSHNTYFTFELCKQGLIDSMYYLYLFCLLMLVGVFVQFVSII